MEAAQVAKLNDIDPTVLGARLKAARKAAGMTQPAMGGGEASTAYISRIERGERRPSVRLFELFCDRIGVSQDSILGGTGRDDLRRYELELDYADLSLITGDAEGADRRARAILDDSEAARHRHLKLRAGLLCAHASANPGRYTEAISGLRDYLDSEPASPSWPAAATTLSRVLRETGDLSGSIAAARQALSRISGTELSGSEESIRLSVTLAASVYEAGDVESARQICEEAIADSHRLESPRARASAYWNTSVIETEAGNLDRAVLLAQRALSLLEGIEESRNLARLRTQLGEILLRVDPPQIDSAVEYLRRAAEDYRWTESSDADRQQNRLVLARAALLQGDLAGSAGEAQAVLDSGTTLPFPTVAALVLLGQVAWSSERQAEAREFYTRAVLVLTSIGADREAGQMWFDLGNLLGEAGMHEEASDAFRRSAASVGLTGRARVSPVSHLR